MQTTKTAICLQTKAILLSPIWVLRIDTSGWGVNFDALFDKVRRSCYLRDYYILYIIR